MKIHLKIVGAILFGFINMKCNQAQNTTINIPEKGDSIKKSPENRIVNFTVFKIDTIPDSKQVNRRTPTFIKKRLELLIGKSMKEKCEKIGVKYPPQYILHRTFKYEGEYEIWAGNSQTDSLKLLATLPICAVDNSLGTKLQQGDGKTPEGFYNCTIMYGSQMNFMWMNLNTCKIDDYGEVGGGCSSFKICIDYPLPEDRKRTSKTLGKTANPGDAICIHGNCVSAGCISFENKNYLPVFLSQLYHNRRKYGKVKVHIYPYRFNNYAMVTMAKKADSELKTNDLVSFWSELQKGYDLFETSHKAFLVTNKAGKYIFKQY